MCILYIYIWIIYIYIFSIDAEIEVCLCTCLLVTVWGIIYYMARFVLAWLFIMPPALATGGTIGGRPWPRGGAIGVGGPGSYVFKMYIYIHICKVYIHIIYIYA